MKEVVNSKHNTAVTTSYTAYHAITTSAIPTDTEKYVIVNPEESINIDVNEEGKYSVFDIANWFLTKGQMTHTEITLFYSGNILCTQQNTDVSRNLSGLGTWTGFSCIMGAF